MKNKKPFSGIRSIRFLLSIALISQVFLFSQCDKENDELPIPEAPIEAGVPDNATGDTSSPGDSTSTTPDSTATNPNPADTTVATNPETPDQTGSSPIVTEPNEPVVSNPTAPSNPSTPPQQAISYTIKANESIVDGSKLNLAPGAVVVIESGTRGSLLLRNFNGTKSAPITFINGSGKTTIQSSGSYGLKTENCTFFRVTGSGSSGKGLVVDGGHIGMSFDKLSNEFVVDNVEVMNCGFAGIMAKTDPSCDQATWRGNFLMQNLKFYNNYVHDVKGEGFYIGNSFHEGGRDLECGKIAPHEITNVEIFNNRTANTGCEGIQAGCVVSGLKIYSNTVENFGTDPFAPAQNNGVQIGEGSSGNMFNNVIKNGPGNGIIMLGRGNTKIYNNLVLNPGSYGAFIDNRGNTSGDILFAQNTFINAAMGGLKTYNELVKNKFYNNIITGPGQPFIYGSNATGEELNNLTTANEADCGFASGSYKPKAGSPAIDKGMSSGITNDIEGKGRPSGAANDIGAYEY